MDKEIKQPFFTEPKFLQPAYDYRNYEKAGDFRGVGESGKTASFERSKSIDVMPQKQHSMMVPRDHKG